MRIHFYPVQKNCLVVCVESKKQNLRSKGCSLSKLTPNGKVLVRGRCMSVEVQGVVQLSTSKVVTVQPKPVPELRLFALRHQKRNPEDGSFLSPLLEAGVRDAKEVNAPQLAMLQPTQIYSSPYLRVLQTLEPFLIQDRANLNNTGRVKVEYSLYEHNDQDYSDKSHNLHPAKTVPDAWHQRFHIDSSYGSYLAPEELVEYNSTQEKVHFRVKRFVKHLLEEYHGTSEVILLVSHQNIVHSLLHQTTDKPMEDFGVQMGELVEVDWTKL
ncbi:hypothetical protein CYMTET_16017 [Cymbomonas tetramitiformis]|uniref:Uncharacterized protein n=1 Tax=Cymbomonas tetramitiformis TaxID=36881 RepID=A0AAE0GD70_9CHLO|nr:hypothetical protein CYMTET_16017 [Cymbomonas tetramitiformis]